eukprot:TRINITY_DN41932_c0_g1_i1.p1 TRINITY_DN41932_c0_g1~~TRINITY_DN41932_c0_g1_i1.p1  ORF type:complete len:115 (+),score=2.20 TRINITY_DN41932_c0_g1_i1:160-504(+)
MKERKYVYGLFTDAISPSQASTKWDAIYPKLGETTFGAIGKQQDPYLGHYGKMARFHSNIEHGFKSWTRPSLHLSYSSQPPIHINDRVLYIIIIKALFYYIGVGYMNSISPFMI